jgi:hypothetical protein
MISPPRTISKRWARGGDDTAHLDKTPTHQSGEGAAGRAGVAARNQVRRLPDACRAGPGRVRLLTRTGLDWTHKYRAIAAAVSSLPRIASPEMFPEAEMLPHLICSRPIFIGGANPHFSHRVGASGSGI